MRLLKTFAFVTVSLAIIVAVAYYAGGRLETLDKLIDLTNALTPQSADAGSDLLQPPVSPGAAPAGNTQESPETDTPPAPPRNVSDEARTQVNLITPGMTREQVDGILGQCAYARSGYTDDGTSIRSAVWIVGGDMVAVRFRNGVVDLVTGSPKATLPKAAATKGAGSAKPAAPVCPASSPSIDDEKLRHWQEIERRIREGKSPHDNLQEIFGPSDEEK